jgi:hypothetical protein
MADDKNDPVREIEKEQERIKEEAERTRKKDAATIEDLERELRDKLGGGS